MKKKAAAIGGNAVILVSRRAQYAGTYTTPSSANAFVYGNYIYYTYQPGTSFAMRTKHVIGLVIRWKKKISRSTKDLSYNQNYIEGNVKVYLKDGSFIKGKILTQDEKILILKTSFGEAKLEKDKVKSIEPEEKEMVINLKDGSILKGKILSEDKNIIIIETSLGKLNIDRKNILEITPNKDMNINKKEQKNKKEYIGKKTKEGDIIPITNVDIPPVLIKSIAPKYHWEETQLVTQKFVVKVLISEKGDVEIAEIVEGKQNYEPINKAVMKAVKKWKFKPAIKDGVKVKVWKKVIIRVNRN